MAEFGPVNIFKIDLSVTSFSPLAYDDVGECFLLEEHANARCSGEPGG